MGKGIRTNRWPHDALLAQACKIDEMDAAREADWYDYFKAFYDLYALRLRGGDFSTLQSLQFSLGHRAHRLNGELEEVKRAWHPWVWTEEFLADLMEERGDEVSGHDILRESDELDLLLQRALNDSYWFDIRDWAEAADLDMEDLTIRDLFGFVSEKLRESKRRVSDARWNASRLAGQRSALAQALSNDERLGYPLLYEELQVEPVPQRSPPTPPPPPLAEVDVDFVDDRQPHAPFKDWIVGTVHYLHTEKGMSRTEAYQEAAKRHEKFHGDMISRHIQHADGSISTRTVRTYYRAAEVEGISALGDLTPVARTLG